MTHLWTRLTIRAFLAFVSPTVAHAADNISGRRGIDPDDICADGGVDAWMVVAKELQEHSCVDRYGVRLGEILQSAAKRINATQ